MGFAFGPRHPLPEESYSRRLDEMVAAQEMPYGYDTAPPAAGQENTPQERLQGSKGKRGR